MPICCKLEIVRRELAAADRSCQTSIPNPTMRVEASAKMAQTKELNWRFSRFNSSAKLEVPEFAVKPDASGVGSKSEFIVAQFRAKF